MIETFAYDGEYDPPRPMILADISSHDRRREQSAQLALLDTAADCSLLPLSLADALHLKPNHSEQLRIRTAGEDILVLPTCMVRVRIGQLAMTRLKIIVHPDLPYILLGRDFLNQYRILFDGPDLKISIS